ncbi:class I SAM-dependent methyltransferase [Azospirillum sp. CT11-132]|uniref:class I SAM-dependent methyltransferase n=1 Tax=Azospirillum sp. CT11-132 TaxID=3396317 RepID=UPI0039A4C716
MTLVETEDLGRIHAAGWPLPQEMWLGWSAYDKSFAVHELTGLRSFDYYKKRIAALGFTGKDAVLDLGCGIGQWSCALACANGHVLALDPNKDRLSAASRLSAALGIGNCSYAGAAAERLPCADGAIDAVFCYGVFMFTDMPRSLTEMHRVLKPGGVVYINANSWGWYAHLLMDRGLRQGDWKMARTALDMARRAFSGATSQMLVRRGWLSRQIRDAGFEAEAWGREGEIALSAIEKRPPAAYPRNFYGLPAILEVILRKPA